ncbi:MAG: hypothetical protein QOF48_3726 [Verrucomicrobiota bacterium]|jgi:hypothetical protein
MRFNPIHNPVGPAISAACGIPRTPAAKTPAARSQAAGPLAAGPISLAHVPDTTLAFMLMQAAGRSADLGKCAALAPDARTKFSDWLAHRVQYGHPLFSDWRPAFTSFAAIFTETHDCHIRECGTGMVRPRECLAHDECRPQDQAHPWLKRTRLCRAA